MNSVQTITSLVPQLIGESEQMGAVTKVESPKLPVTPTDSGIAPLTSPKPLTIVENEVRNLLNLPVEKTSLLPLVEAAPASTSVGVADGIMHDLASSLVTVQHQGKSGGELFQLLADARIGIEQGIKNSDEVLANLSVGDTEQKEVTQLYADLLDGLDKLTASLKAVEGPLALGNHFVEENHMFLELVTKDGDLIQIGMDQHRSYDAELSLQWNSGNPVFTVAAASDAGVVFDVQISGNLDDDEEAMVAELVRGVNQFATDLIQSEIDFSDWSGGIGYLDIDESQLKSIDFYSSHSATGQAGSKLSAGSEYDDISEGLGGDASIFSDSNKDILRNLVKLLDSVELFEKPEDTLKQLVKSRLAADPQVDRAEIGERLNEQVDQLFAVYSENSD